MKFKFSLEKLLGHKKILEDIARRDYVDAQKKVDLEISKLSQFRDDLTQAYKQKFVVQNNGGAIGEALKSINEFMEGKKIEIKNQEIIIQGLQKISEEKRIRLVSAAQDHKVYEKLKEKKLIDFKTILKKKDKKNIDELVVTFAKRGKEYE